MEFGISARKEKCKSFPLLFKSVLNILVIHGCLAHFLIFPKPLIPKCLWTSTLHSLPKLVLWKSFPAFHSDLKWSSAYSVGLCQVAAAPRTVLLPRELPLCLAGSGILTWRNCGNTLLQMVCTFPVFYMSSYRIGRICSKITDFPFLSFCCYFPACVTEAILTAHTRRVRLCAPSTATGIITPLMALNMTTTLTARSTSSKWVV